MSAPAKKIVIIQGHPDPGGGHYCHALAKAYAEGAERAGHELRTVNVASLKVPLLSSREDWESGEPPASLAGPREALKEADHLLIVYPLWLGTMPAMLKAFFEQMFRPGYAFEKSPRRQGFRSTLGGRSARIVVTMGMPAWVYRWYFGAHSLKSLERNILRFVGIKPVRSSVIGMVEQSGKRRARWLDRMRRLGMGAR